MNIQSNISSFDLSDDNDSENGKRSIIVGGLTKDISLDKIINAFQNIEITGGGLIQNFDIYDHDKIRITYLNRQDAERVLQKGNAFIIENTLLYVSKFINQIHQYQNESIPNSAINSLDFTNKNNNQMAKLDLIDEKRIILTNVLEFVGQDYLELYIEFLSNEVEIVRFDLSKELKDAIVVTFENNIDFKSIKNKHDTKPNLMNVRTELFPVYLPDTVIIETKEKIQNFQFNKEILELYFSNKKRSGGENVNEIRFSSKNNRIAYITFKGFESAKRVAQKKIHIINKVNFESKLYYKNIGPDPFNEVKNNLFKNTKKSLNFKNEYKRDIQNSLSTSISNLNQEELHQRSFYRRPTKSHIYTELGDYSVQNLENKIDPSSLTNKQTDYLLELQSIYNELNNSNVTLFTTNPDTVNPVKKDDNDFIKSLSTTKSETELKYLSEFILDEASDFKRKLGSNSLMSKDTELEVNDIYNCRFKGCSFEEDSLNLFEKQIKDMETKPIVNLPRLDDMVSFEEYKILNNIKTQKISQVYSEVKNGEIKLEDECMNKNNMHPEVLQKGFKKIENELETNTLNQALIQSSDTNQYIKTNPLAFNNDDTMANNHKALRAINFSSRQHPRVIYRSRDRRPPPPKLVKLNNSKKANPDNLSEKTQTPPSSMSLFDSNFVTSGFIVSKNQYPLTPSVNPNMAFTPTLTRISSRNKIEKTSDIQSNNANSNYNHQNFTKYSKKVHSTQKELNNRLHNFNTYRNSAISNFTQETSFKIETPSVFFDSSFMRLNPDTLSSTDPHKKQSNLNSFKLEVSNRIVSTPLEANNNISTVLLNTTLNSIPSNVYSINSENGRLSVKIGQKSSFLATEKVTPRPRLVSKVSENESLIKSYGGGTWKKSKAVKKNYRLNNHIIEQYGRITEADSISKIDGSKLNENHMEFFKKTNYINYLKIIYPKISINLNENLKSLYFFGARDQVNNAKVKIVNDLNAFKSTELPIDQKEILIFLQKPDVKIKINDFINNYIISYESNKKREQNKEKENEFSKADVFKVLFCNYDVNTAVMKKENENSSNSKHCLRIFTNIVDFDKILFKHINETIIFNYKIEINQNSILSITKQDTNWNELYLKYSKYLDFSIESYKEANVLKEVNPNLAFKQKKWFIKLTGFRDELEKFKIEFKKKFMVY